MVPCQNVVNTTCISRHNNEDSDVTTVESMQLSWRALATIQMSQVKDIPGCPRKMA